MTPRLRAGDLLAAYGLLRPGSYGLDRLRVRARVREAGACVIPGRIISLGDFPALLPGEGEVRGDLLRLLDRGAGALLDRYENFDPRNPDASEYRRVRIRLVRPAVHAWVYMWNGPTHAGPVVPGGDWLKR